MLRSLVRVQHAGKSTKFPIVCAEVEWKVVKATADIYPSSCDSHRSPTRAMFNPAALLNFQLRVGFVFEKRMDAYLISGAASV